MPKKSVLEINPFERMHYSLSGRTFRAIVLFSLIITVTAVSFGYYLYSSSVEREFRSRTWQMSKTAAMLLDRMENSRMVFITDSDSKESFCPPGCWDQLDSKDREALLNGRQYFLDKLFGTGHSGLSSAYGAMRIPLHRRNGHRHGGRISCPCGF